MPATSSAIEGLHRCVAPASQAFTIPPAWYVDDELFAEETNAVFRRGWVGVGRAERWPKAGAYAAIEIGGVPVVIGRGDDGRLRAFANSCRHRASQIMVGEGTCARFRCPFHFWTYALDGRLIGAPSMQQTPGFDAAEHGLIDFPVAESHGFAFVSVDPDPPVFATWLGDFGAHHAPWPLAELRMARRRELVVDCNWKAFAEVFNEYYHLPYVHPDSIDENYLEPDEPESSSGAYATQFGRTQGSGGLLDDDRHLQFPIIAGLPERERTGVRYTWLFPNVVFAAGADALWMYEVYPDGPHRCNVAQTVCFPESTMSLPEFTARAEHYYERFDVALDEDIPALTQQHAGLQSPFAEQGRFSYLEPSVASFAAWYAQRVLRVHPAAPATPDLLGAPSRG